MISENVSRYENVVVRNHKEIGINNYGLDYLVKVEQELERYKNIIDELEKWLELQRDNLDKRVSEMKSDDKNMTRANHYTFIYNRVIDKLKELKGE